MADYLTAYLVLTQTGMLPWEVGLNLPRRRFKQALVLLAQTFGYLQLSPSAPACPFFGTGK